MQLTLDSELQRRITDRVISGKYASAEDVIAAALRALESEEQALEFAPGELDRLIAEGDASGSALDGQTVLTELKARHLSRAKQH